MDPKMDSGVENSGYCSAEEAIDNGAAPIPLSLDRTIDVQRTIDVMDHLLACEVLLVLLYCKLFAGHLRFHVFNTFCVGRQRGIRATHWHRLSFHAYIF